MSEVTIVGSGIIGLATAWKIKQAIPKLSITIVEKESREATHQSGRNSGVIHTGIYYKPGSLKANFTKSGRNQLANFCREENIPVIQCGKLIVATNEKELVTLKNIYEKGTQNGVRIQLLEKNGMHEIEPHVRGIKALHVPEAAITDFHLICSHLRKRLESCKVNFCWGQKVESIREERDAIKLITSNGTINSKYVVNCAGLYSDEISNKSDQYTDVKIVPFRGQFYDLGSEIEHVCRGLIYPVPDPRFPFLGVHLTRKITGGVKCGPNALIPFAKEGYNLSDFNGREFASYMFYPGLLRLVANHIGYGAGELYRTLSKHAFARAVQKLVPDVNVSHLKSGKSGIRAQAVTRKGGLVDDFVICSTARCIHVVNAPSPAATASFAIGEHIFERFRDIYI